MQILGIDIGGSGIKGAVVDMKKGELVGERFRVETPHPCVPKALMGALGAIFEHFKWNGLVGIGFPGVVRNDVIYNAPNLDRSLAGLKLAEKIYKRHGLRSSLINDADAAGVAEMRFGSGKNMKGLTILVTIGTGLGSGVFYDGVLIPNIEFGHVMMKERDTGKWRESEKINGGAARTKYDLNWDDWSQRFSDHLRYLCSVFYPDHIILGGGITSKADKFLKKLDCPAPLSIARFENQAGIVGAAANARDHLCPAK